MPRSTTEITGISGSGTTASARQIAATPGLSTTADEAELTIAHPGEHGGAIAFRRAGGPGVRYARPACHHAASTLPTAWSASPGPAARRHDRAKQAGARRRRWRRP